VPELPEVETTRRGLEPHVLQRRIISIDIRQPKLRWPIPQQVSNLEGSTIISLQRRAKYLLMQTDNGTMIWHLGMSGSMRIMPEQTPAVKHEHVQLTFDNHSSLRFKDPRRFGSLLFTSTDPLQHKLLIKLGPEPLNEEFNADYLQTRCKGRSTAIKNLIMDSHVVVGVGNIYACESLFLSGINPKTSAGRISYQRLQKLTDAIKAILIRAISQGGTTLQDFTQADGKPGYFSQSLSVYSNRGKCPDCGNSIKRTIQGQRTTFYCTHCQH
jgi:formamidopyrimidine-DNA glycosylase